MQVQISNKPPYSNMKAIEKAQNGDSFAQLDLGKAYFSAYLTKDNCSLAFKWISLSAQQNNMEAQFRLGDLYALGQGTEQSHTRAYEWYTKSALQGYSKALIRIHNLYEEDKFLHCKGYQNKDEVSLDFRSTKYRTLRENRLQQSILIQNRAMEYYQQQLKTCLQRKLKDTTVQLQLGFMYHHGYGVRKNLKLAIEYYNTAAAEGVSEAQYNLGEIYHNKQNIKDNTQEAFRWFSKAANNGSEVAQYNLAYLYEKGIGVEKDYPKALYWYTKASKRRYSPAQLSIARIYRTGLGVPQNYRNAIEWYNIAARGGNRAAQNCLDQLHSQDKNNYKGNNISELEYYKSPIEGRRVSSILRKHISEIKDLKKEKELKTLAMNIMRGDINAMYQVGVKYRDGVDLPQDSDLSFKWIKKSAKGGLEKAQLTTGKLYEEGELVDQNYHKSSIWYKKGVLNKNDTIQYHLGMMYYHGRGVRKDRLEASKWFYMSADKNNSNSQYQIGYMRLYGQGLRQDSTDALNWFMKSAYQGNVDAIYMVSFIYLHDEQIERDKQKGIEWMKQAVYHGSDDAGNLVLTDDTYRDAIVDSKLPELFLTGSHRKDQNVYLDYILSICYLKGHIVKQDYIKAYHFINKSWREFLLSTPVRITDYESCSDLIKMYKLISQRGIANLEYNIGYAYEYGIYNADNYKVLLDVDISQAIEWYTTASKKGDSRADYRLGAIYAGEKRTEKNLPMAVTFYTQAVERGNFNGMYRLACLYLRGESVPQNLEKAFQLFTESHDMGQPYSCLFLKLERFSAQPKFNLDYYDNVFLSEEDGENESEYYSNESESITLAFKMLETVAQSENLAVQYRLGCLYGDTESEDIDYSKAAYWLSLASQGGITDAYYRLGVLYEEGRGVQKDYSQSLTLYQKAADENHDKALYRLARMYQHGLGIPTDFGKAFMLYTESAKEENDRAQMVITLLKDHGDKSSQGPKESPYGLTISEVGDLLTIYENVANNGNISIQFELGYYFENDQSRLNYTKAIKWYSMAYESGHIDATYRLGRLYELGLGIIQNYDYALKLYTIAKKGGCNEATFRLGYMHQTGLGTIANHEQAVNYYTEASMEGNIDAQFQLGQMYDQTVHDSKNILDALKWYTKSYLRGNDDTRESLYLLYDNDKPYEDFFYAKLVKIMLRYAMNKAYHQEKNVHNSSSVYARLCHMYLNGLGVQKDKYIAWSYLRISLKLDLRIQQNIPDGAISKVIKENISEIYNVALEESGKNDSWANILLGLLYLGGVEILEDSQENDNKNYSSVFEDTLDLGDSNFQCQRKSTGMIIVPKDHEKSFQHFLTAADNGSEYSRLMVAYMYQCGYGTKQDFIKASEYYQSDSNSNSKYNFFTKGYLNLLIVYGDKTSENSNQAPDFSEFLFPYPYFYYSKAQLYYYGHVLPQNYKAALECLINLRDHEIRVQLFLIVRMDESKLNKQPDKSDRVYTLVSGGTLFGEMEYLIGIMNEKGQGTRINYKEAFEGFSKAVKYGNKKAEKHLALHYKDGKFIE